jgi:hypothetical protein
VQSTFGVTQTTLHQLFDGVDQATRDRILFGSFAELFPDAPPATATRSERWLDRIGNVQA